MRRQFPVRNRAPALRGASEINPRPPGACAVVDRWSSFCHRNVHFLRDGSQKLAKIGGGTATRPPTPLPNCSGNATVSGPRLRRGLRWRWLWWPCRKQDTAHSGANASAPLAPVVRLLVGGWPRYLGEPQQRPRGLLSRARAYQPRHSRCWPLLHARSGCRFRVWGGMVGEVTGEEGLRAHRTTCQQYGSEGLAT